MNTQSTTRPHFVATSRVSPTLMIDVSGFAPMIGTAISMIGMLVLVAGSAVHVML